MMINTDEITQLLLDWRAGREEALQQLMPIVYSELKRIAHLRLQRERRDHSLQTTELINELYMRLIAWREISWQNRNHFFAVAASLMRNILIDYARGYQAEKRGNNYYKIELTELPNLSMDRSKELLALEDALNALATFDERQSKIVEMRYFGGLNVDEVAEILQISPTTVKREWRLARAWLLQELANQHER